MLAGYMTPAEKFANLVDEADAQGARIQGGQPRDDPWGGPIAKVFRFNPNQVLDENRAIIASYVRPDDVLIDVGGGAGRVSLPLALRCRQTVTVDPSPGMRAEFEELAATSGITNARFHQTDWLSADDVEGDVVFSADVIYFVRDIVPFLEKLQAEARRRVMITLWSVPPPNRQSALFRLVNGEALKPRPGHRELMAVLWDMGVLPDIRVMPDDPWWDRDVPQTREEALDMAARGRWSDPAGRVMALGVVEAHFEDLFERSPEGYRPLWYADARELLITWETNYS